MASTRLSVSNCRTNRPRPAPIDALIASSTSRVAPRASIRPATLTQAMIRMRPTAIDRVRIVGPNCSVSSSYIDWITTRAGTGVGPIMVDGGVTLSRAAAA